MSTTPTTLGKYQIIREIARSNDIVYEAYDPLMNRRVALKELSIPGGSTNVQRDDRILRFKREVKAAGSLAQANIVTIYEVGEDNGRYFMAMEYLDGHTLRNELDTRGFIDADRAIEIAMEILEGLEFAHNHGVVHRDIKPENIQILESGQIKLTDFGIARLTFEPNLTMDGQVFGTPSYMSPEQVVGKDIDARSDIFSVGVVLYEMICGQKPFPGDSIVSITHSIMNAAPVKPAQMEYPLWQIVEQAINKTSNLRYATAKDMRQALLGFARGYAGTMHQAPPTAPLVDPVANPYANPYAYNPYAPPGTPAPPPMVNQAYLQPYGQQQLYQPYAQGYGQTYGQPGGQMPPIPVYYPPPPRQPLMSPESKAFWGKLFITLALVGALFALVFAGVNAISQAIAQDQMKRHDQKLREEASSGRANTSAESKIDVQKQVIEKLQSPEEIRVAKKQLAVDYERQGKGYLNAARFKEAEQAFTTAHDNDPGNPLLLANLADLYEKEANLSPDLIVAAGLFHQAGSAWLRAGEAPGARAQEYRAAGARCFINSSDKYFEYGRKNEAQTELDRAEPLVEMDSTLGQEIQKRKSR